MRIDFPNTDAFYNDSPVRRFSPEADFGVHWTDGSDWPRYRVSHIRDTGELYATSLSGGGHAGIEILGVIPADDVPDGEAWYSGADAILEGWSDPTITELQWIRDRMPSRG
jgi:hypothetical protein